MSVPTRRSGEADYIVFPSQKDNKFKIEKLKDNTVYQIKIEAINQNGKGEKEIVVETQKMPKAEGNVLLEDLVWKEDLASIVVKKQVEDEFQIQYRIKEGEFILIQNGSKIENLMLGDKIEVRLWDGINGGDSISYLVQYSVQERLKAGDYVQYEDKNGEKRECVVLYDGTSEYGIQIITTHIVENFTINTITPWWGNIGIEKVNTQASQYLNSNLSSTARCVGSIPDRINEGGQSGDSNYTYDWNQMSSLGITNIKEAYWLASLRWYDPGIYNWKYMRYVNTSGGIQEFSMYYWDHVKQTGGYTAHTCGLRPVFDLNANVVISGGSGIASDPYTIMVK